MMKQKADNVTAYLRKGYRRGAVIAWIILFFWIFAHLISDHVRGEEVGLIRISSALFLMFIAWIAVYIVRNVHVRLSEEGVHVCYLREVLWPWHRFESGDIYKGPGTGDYSMNPVLSGERQRYAFFSLPTIPMLKLGYFAAPESEQVNEAILRRWRPREIDIPEEITMAFSKETWNFNRLQVTIMLKSDIHTIQCHDIDRVEIWRSERENPHIQYLFVYLQNGERRELGGRSFKSYTLDGWKGSSMEEVDAFLRHGPLKDKTVTVSMSQNPESQSEKELRMEYENACMYNSRGDKRWTLILLPVIFICLVLTSLDDEHTYLEITVANLVIFSPIAVLAILRMVRSRRRQRSILRELEEMKFPE